MEFYVAGSRTIKDIVSVTMASLRKLGHNITHDWVNELKSSMKMSTKAELDKMGVANADVVVAFVPGGPGTNFEIGYASALKKPVLLISIMDIDDDGLIFYECDNIRALAPPPDLLAELFNPSLISRGADRLASLIIEAIRVRGRPKVGQPYTWRI